MTVHVGLGLTILVLGVLRLLRRRFDGLPAWDERLSARDRRWVTRIERAGLVLRRGLLRRMLPSPSPS